MTKGSLVNTASILIIATLSVVALVVGKVVLIPLATAVFLALIILPVCRAFESIGIPRVVSVVLAEFVLLLIFVVFFGLFLLQMFQFATDIPAVSEKIINWYNEFSVNFSQDNMIDKTAIDEYLEDNFISLFKSSGSIVSLIMGGFSSAITFLILVPIYTFMLLSYRKNFKYFIQAQSARQKNAAGVVADKTVEMVGKYLTGLFIVILLMAVVNSVALYFIGLKYYAFFGCFAALLILIPYIGALVGSILPIVFSLAVQDSIMLPIYVAIYFLAVQILEGNFITPKIVGKSVNVNPLTVIVAVIIGGLIWGLVGMILAVPIAATIRIVLQNNEELKSYALLMADKVEEQDKPDKN